MNISIKRIYETAEADDGLRILVDRLWPRGIKKEDARLDRWAKDISPSNELRKWYHADMDNRWEEFQQRYLQELESCTAQLHELKTLVQKQKVILLTAAKNEERNHATVLSGLLQKY